MTSAHKRIASHRVRVCETWRGHVHRFSMTANSKRTEVCTDSVAGPASGNQSLHFIFFRRKTIRGMGQFQLTVAISTLSLHATKVVRFELLEIV